MSNLSPLDLKTTKYRSSPTKYVQIAVNQVASISLLKLPICLLDVQFTIAIPTTTLDSIMSFLNSTVSDSLLSALESLALKTLKYRTAPITPTTTRAPMMIAMSTPAPIPESLEVEELVVTVTTGGAIAATATVVPVEVEIAEASVLVVQVPVHPPEYADVSTLSASVITKVTVAARLSATVESIEIPVLYEEHGAVHVPIAAP